MNYSGVTILNTFTKPALVILHKNVYLSLTVKKIHIYKFVSLIYPANYAKISRWTTNMFLKTELF